MGNHDHMITLYLSINHSLFFLYVYIQQYNIQKVKKALVRSSNTSRGRGAGGMREGNDNRGG